MSTLLDTLTASMRAIGAAASGEPLEPAEAQDALAAYGRMMRAWSADGLGTFAIAINAYPLTAGKQIVTIGIDPTGAATADIQAPRPNEIVYANVILANGLRQPLRVIRDEREWASIKLQSVGSTIPQRIYCDNNFPLAKLYFYPYPSESIQLELHTKQPLDSITDLTAELVLPDGYEEAIIYNLARRLAVEFARPLSAELADMARESKALIQSANSPSPLAECDAAGLNTGRRSNFNWLTGECG